MWDFLYIKRLLNFYYIKYNILKKEFRLFKIVIMLHFILYFSRTYPT